MEETNIRFEDLPEAVQWIKNKLTEIALKIDRMHGNAIEKEEPPQWFSIQELCDYLPEQQFKRYTHGRALTAFLIIKRESAFVS